MVSRICNYH